MKKLFVVFLLLLIVISLGCITQSDHKAFQDELKDRGYYKAYAYGGRVVLVFTPREQIDIYCEDSIVCFGGSSDRQSCIKDYDMALKYCAT